MIPDSTAAEAVANDENLLWQILQHIEPDPDKTVPIDRRRFLSVESFDRSPADPTRDSIADIGRFRCVCRTFASVAEPLLFTRVATRFSKRGLRKLEQLAQWDHLCRHVKKFTYLVPYFFASGTDSLDALGPFGIPAAHVASLHRKADEQALILATQQDARALREAIAKFRSLQFVQLLRVTDAEDRQVLSVLSTYEDAAQHVQLDWTAACVHAARTIGKALLASGDVPWSRFSSPMLSPASAEFLRASQPQSLSVLAERLTCLHLHFDEDVDLDATMRDLSGLFGAVFRRAKAMQAVHVGFPSTRPVTLPLEEVFHNVTWEKLVAFGVQGWELHENEIIALAERHQRLKGLRLRDVHLKDGSRWKNVLGYLRNEMYRLEWVSLRRIGYAGLPGQNGGAEIMDLPSNPDEDSESDDDDEGDDDEEDHSYDGADASIAGPSNSLPRPGNFYDPQHANDFTDDDDEYSDVASNSDDEVGPDANEMDFPNLNSPSTPVSMPWCDCSNSAGLDSADDIGDDDMIIDNAKRKFWEKWVLRHCPRHGGP